MRYIIVGEGNTDQVLRWPIEWLLDNYLVDHEHIYVDMSQIKARGSDLESKLHCAITLYRPDVVFLHRDSDNADPNERLAECRKAILASGFNDTIPVIPVRMTEAWFLFDREAIARAAGNPAQASQLTLPTADRCHTVTNPKGLLKKCLIEASCLSGRRRTRFKTRVNDKIYRVAELVNDFSPLRNVTSFQEFEDRLSRYLQQIAGQAESSGTGIV